jgi:hypothetical protein
MNEQEARAFLKCLNAKHIDSQVYGGWLKCSCPLAPFRHEKKKDNNPSFALLINDNEKARYNCFACGCGSAEELLQAIELYTRGSTHVFYDFKTAHQILSSEEVDPYELDPYSEFGGTDYVTFQEWPEAFVQSFIPAIKVEMAHEYLFGASDQKNQFGQRCRGITENHAINFDLRYDHARGMVVFPYRDAFGRLAGMRGRSIVEHKHHDYTWKSINNAKLVWYNEQVLDSQPGWVVVVEGQFDCLRVAYRWPKVVANMTALPRMEKLKKLTHAEGTILIPDNDDTGMKSVAYYKDFHAKRNHPFQVLYLPTDVKDADECNPDYLYDRIINLTT